MRIGVTERGDAGLDQSWLQRLNTVDGCIAITKHPSLLPKELPSNVLVHCTITGLGGGHIEPNVNKATDELFAYYKLVDKYGGERIILRIDPIIWGIEQAAYDVAKHACGRVRVSFLDLYPHVKQRFAAQGITISQTEFHAPLEERIKILQALEAIVPEVEVCAEPGIACSGCVSQRDLSAIGLKEIPHIGGKQRPLCKCIAEKVELLNSKKQCPSGCLYCYWRGL
jgi:DNA repair photolyase